MKNFILALYVLYLPFQLRLPQTPVINTLNLFLFLLFIVFVFTKRPGKVKIRFELPLVLFLICWVLSFMHTVFNPRWVWLTPVAADFKMLISLVFGYFVFSSCVTNKKDIRFLLSVFLFTLVLVGLHTYRNGTLAGAHFADFKRSSGPFGVSWFASDIVGGFLAIFTPLILAYTFFAKKRILQFFGFIGLVICILGLFTTYSRGSILALGFATVVIILFTLRYLPKLSKFSTFLVLLIVIAGFFSWKSWVPQTIINRMDETLIESKYEKPAELDKGSTRRIEIWRSSIQLVKINPLFGIGFKQVLPLLGVDPHNTFLLIAIEMGILTLLIFLWFLLSIFRVALSLLKTDFTYLGIGFIGCITAFLVVNIFYANFFRDTVIGSFWIMLGLLASAKKVSYA